MNTEKQNTLQHLIKLVRYSPLLGNKSKKLQDVEYLSLPVNQLFVLELNKLKQLHSENVYQINPLLEYLEFTVINTIADLLIQDDNIEETKHRNNILHEPAHRTDIIPLIDKINKHIFNQSTKYPDNDDYWDDPKHIPSSDDIPYKEENPKKYPNYQMTDNEWHIALPVTMAETTEIFYKYFIKEYDELHHTVEHSLQNNSDRIVLFNKVNMVIEGIQETQGIQGIQGINAKNNPSIENNLGLNIKLINNTYTDPLLNDKDIIQISGSISYRKDKLKDILIINI